jgi:hypothetical protein
MRINVILAWRYVVRMRGVRNYYSKTLSPE